MPRILVAFDGDNVERTLANELQRRLNYPRLMALIPMLVGDGTSLIEAVGFFTVPQSDSAMARQQEGFEELQSAGITIRRSRKGRNPRTGRTIGYSDRVVADYIRQRSEEFEVLVLVTADRRGFLGVVGELQANGQHVITISPQPVWWPPPITAFELEELDCQYGDLLLPLHRRVRAT